MGVQVIAPVVLGLALLLGCRSGSQGDQERGQPDSGLAETPGAMTDSTVRAEGTIRSVNIEGGCWRLDTPDGKHYEIARDGVPQGLLVDGRQATLVLRPRPDLMSSCMIGPIVEVVRVEP